MEEWIKTWHSWAEHKRYYQEIFIGWKLENKTRDKHIILYRQYINMAKMVQIANGAK